MTKSKRLPDAEVLAILTRRLRSILPDRSRLQEHKQLQRRISELEGVATPDGFHASAPSRVKKDGASPS